MNKQHKEIFLSKFPGGHFEYGEDYYDGYDKDNNHIVSCRKNGNGIWGDADGFEAPDGSDTIFGDSPAPSKGKASKVSAS